METLNQFYFKYFGKLAAMVVGILVGFWLVYHLSFVQSLYTLLAVMVGGFLYYHYKTAQYEYQMKKSRLESEKEVEKIRERKMRRGGGGAK